MDIYQHDQAFRQKGFGIIAGIDEAGRGPIAGPVVAAAVVLPENLRIEGLRDSKKVPEKERESLFWDIVTLSKNVGIGMIGHEEIDRYDILQCTKLAMKIAMDDLSVLPDMIIIDAVSLPSIPVKQISPIKAESKSASVAAASIIAKYVRDVMMVHYHDVYPEYNFKKHKGYCTQEHLNMIRLHGPCPIHRKSFKKVMSMTLPW